MLLRHSAHRTEHKKAATLTRSPARRSERDPDTELSIVHTDTHTRVTTRPEHAHGKANTTRHSAREPAPSIVTLRPTLQATSPMRTYAIGAHHAPRKQRAAPDSGLSRNAYLDRPHPSGDHRTHAHPEKRPLATAPRPRRPTHSCVVRMQHPARRPAGSSRATRALARARDLRRL